MSPRVDVGSSALLVASVALAGCATIHSWLPAARKAAREAEQTKSQAHAQQARNMRFADDYVGLLIQSERGIESSKGDARQRYQLSGWVLQQANAAYSTASGDNPKLSALDLLTLAVLSRMVMEDGVAPRLAQGEASELVETHRKLEVQAWQLVGGVVDQAQQETLRSLFVEWRKQNPTVENAGFVRFRDFIGSAYAPDSAAGTKKWKSLHALIGLDPLAGLDPAVRQVEQSRLLAERALYYIQRVSYLADLQLDRSLNRVAAGPESQKLLQQGSSLTLSAERFAAVAEHLPDAFSREREALIRQLSEELVVQQKTLAPMLREVRGMLEAGTVTAASLDRTIRSFDALVARLSSKPTAAGSATPSRPFDINEYTRAAEEISRTASQLQRLLDSVGGRASELDSALDRSVGKARSLIDYLVLRVAALIVLLLAGILGTLLLYRRLAPRGSV